MADTTNLSQFLSDIADAIRTKKETTEQIPAENFDTEILSIETGIDTSDATATASDIVVDKTAYVNNTKLTGTIQTLTKDDAPYMLPTTHPSYNTFGSSTLVSNAPEYGDYLYLTNGNYGNVGYVIEFPINILPVDIRGKNILIRYFKDYIVGYDWIDFCVTEYTNSFKGSYHDGTYSILCVDENGTSANFTYYYYTQQNLTFDSITPDSWTLSTSAPSGKSNKQNGHSYSTKKVISTSNSSLVLIPASEDYKFIVKTNVGTSGLKKYVKDEAVLDTKINTTELAEKAGLTSDKILEGNTILGIEGTAETGTQINNQDKEITENGTYTADEGYTGLGTVTVNVPQTGDVPVKLFSTEEEMQADTTAKEGDLAIVYNSEYAPTKAKTKVDTVMFPKTVTLANKVTKTITGYVICKGNSSIECDIELTATSYTVRLEYRGPAKTIIKYTSTDGITYIRETNLADDMYTFNSKYTWITSWSNEILDNFVLTIRKKFNGLFDYRTGLDNKYIELYGNVTVSGYNKYTADIENIEIDKLTKIAYKIEDELGVPKLYVVIKNDSGMFLYRYPDAGVPGVIVYGNDYYRISQNYTREPKSSVDKYTLDLENMTYTKTTLQASSTYEYQTVYETIPKTSFIGILNLTNYSDTLEMFGHNSSSSTSTYPMLNTRRTDIKMTYGTFTKYLIAESQLDDIRPSDLLLGKTGYGSLGVVTGDGSILNVMNKSDLIKNMYGKNNTIYGKAWNRTLARIYNNIAITNEKLNEMTNNMIVPIKLSAYTSDGLNHISLFDKTTESAYSVFSRDYTKYIEPDFSNSRLCVKDTNTGDIIYSYDMVFDNPYDSSKKCNIINIYDDTYIVWNCTSTVGHVYKFNLHEDNVEHTEIDLGETPKSYTPFFNVFAYNNGKLYLTINVDTTSGSVRKYELGYVTVSNMTYHSILSKSVNYYSGANAWSANITSNKDILAYFSIYKDSSSGSSKYWGYLIDSEDNILKSVENSSSTLNEVNFSKTYPDSQRILYDDGTYLYSVSHKINKNTLVATEEDSSYPWHSSYDFSYLFDSHNVYTGENYDNVINMPEIYTGYIYHFDGGSDFVQSAMPSGNGFIWGLENRCASLRGSYDFTISTFDDYDMLLVRPFAADGDTELTQYMFIDKTQYKNTISPTEYNTAIDTANEILGDTTE